MKKVVGTVLSLTSGVLIGSAAGAAAIFKKKAERKRRVEEYVE